MDYGFLQTLPDAQYDDDIEDEASTGMKAKVGDHYVTGMRGDEMIIHKHKHHGTPKSMVGGTHIDLLQTNPDDDDLANKKIVVSGDVASGMAGTETVHGAAVVGGTNVIYHQGGSVPIAQTNQQKLVQTMSEQEHAIDGVAYSNNQSEMDAMIEEHFKPEEVEKPIFAQSDNAEVKRMQGIALSDLEFSKYNEGSDARLAANDMI